MLLLIPALDMFGGPGALLFASGLAALAAPLFAPAGERRRGALSIVPLAAVATGLAVQVWHPWLDVREAKGREAERPIFSKWNSFSRVAVIDREHQDWGLSDTYKGPHVRSLYMDIDSSASTRSSRAGRSTVRSRTCGTRSPGSPTRCAPRSASSSSDPAAAAICGRRSSAARGASRVSRSTRSSSTT
jgi:hypothetical protein